MAGENTLCESLFTYDLLPRFESFLVFWNLLKIILSVAAAVNSCVRCDEVVVAKCMKTTT